MPDPPDARKKAFNVAKGQVGARVGENGAKQRETAGPH